MICVGDKRLRKALYLMTFYSEIMPKIHWQDFQEYLGSYPTFQDRMVKETDYAYWTNDYVTKAKEVLCIKFHDYYLKAIAP